jgi:hypothetical protein
MTIDAQHIPPEVVVEAFKAWLGSEGNQLDGIRAAIATALAAWPGMIKGKTVVDGDPMLFLPLTQEPKDGK